MNTMHGFFNLSFSLHTSILRDTVGMGTIVLFHCFTLQINAKVPGLWVDSSCCLSRCLSCCCRTAIWPAAWNAVRAAIRANVRGYGAVFTRLCECNADAFGVNWGNWVGTIMPARSSCGPHEITCGATFCLRALCMTHLTYNRIMKLVF